MATSRRPIVGYADDSITPEHIVAACAVFAEDRVADAEDHLAAAKRDVGVAPDTALHCRVMFFGDARRGTPWENIAPERIDDLVVRLCHDVKRLTHRPRAVVIVRAEVPVAAWAQDPAIGDMHEKRLASFAYQAIFTPLMHVYGAGAVRVWIDPDKTMVPVGAAGRAAAERTRGLFIDLVPGQEPFRFDPQVRDQPKPALLELADVYAWVIARAHSPSGGRRTRWCRELVQIIDPEIGRFQWAPDMVWHDTQGNEVPAPVPTRPPLRPHRQGRSPFPEPPGDT